MQAYIFDFDGTIADSKKIILKIYNQLSKKYGFDGLDDAKISKLNELNILDKIKYLGIPIIKIKKLYNEAERIYAKEIENVEIFPEMIDIIKSLSRTKNLYIVSSNSKEIIEEVLSKNNILKYFDGIYTSKKLFKKHNVLKKYFELYDAIYIGDESRDIVAAKKANMKSGAVVWGYESKSAILKEYPEHIFNEPSEILKIEDSNEKST